MSFFPDIQREQEKVKRSIKDAAKKGQKDVCVVLAKEMVQSKRAVSKLHASKAHMNSVVLGMRNQLGECRRTAAGERQHWSQIPSCYKMSSLVIFFKLYFLAKSFFYELPAKRIHVYFVAVARVAGALQKSTDVMKAMQSLVKVPEIQATMRDLSKEMMKVG